MTIVQTAMYSITTRGELSHGAAYLPYHPEHGWEFVGVNEDGTETWSLDGVINEDIERMFDTDPAVVSYYQVAPLVRESDEL